MAMQEVRFCIFCKKILDLNCGQQLCESLHLLEILFVNSNLLVYKESQICDNCEENLKNAFKFKEMCIYTDDQLYPYISDSTEQGKKIDLNMVYAKEKNCDPSKATHVCRLCFELINMCNKYLLLETLKKKHFEDIFRNYLPEVNLNVLENPIICEQCKHSLEDFVKFISCTSKVINDVNSVYQGNNSVLDVKPNRPQICKTPEVVDDQPVREEKNSQEVQTGSATSKYNCKHCSLEFETYQELMHHVTSERHFSCELCPYKSKNQIHLEKHMEKHKESGTDDLKMKKCPECDYSSIYESHVRTHVSRMHHVGEVFKCAQCDFRTRYRKTFKQHILKHPKLPQRTRHKKCHLCAFEAVNDSKLQEHMAQNDHSVAKQYTCCFCPYQDVKKYNVKVHMLTHNKTSSETLKCDHCGKETKDTKTLKYHIRMFHMQIPADKLYKCEPCNFITKYKSCLKQHMLRKHPDDESEIVTHKCPECPFEARNWPNLKHHITKEHKKPKQVTDTTPDLQVISHEKPSVLKLMNCPQCLYKSKYKKDFLMHMTVHDKLKPQKCTHCDFKTKNLSLLESHILIHERQLTLNEFNSEENSSKQQTRT